MTMTSIDIARHAPHAWKERSPTLAMDDSSESSGFLKFARRPFTEMMRIVAQKAIRHALDKDMDKVQRDAVGKAIVRQLKWGLPSLKRERLPLAELLQVKGASGSQLKKFGADIGLMPPEQYQRTTFEQDETSYQKSPQHAALVDLGKRLQAEAVRKGEPLGQADLYVLS